MFDDTRTIKNYILSLKERIAILDKEIYRDGKPYQIHDTCQENFNLSERLTLSIVIDDLQILLDNSRNYRTYWVTFNNK
jgi:hypothetical protein